jgi:hypothetical protein
MAIHVGNQRRKLTLGNRRNASVAVSGWMICDRHQWGFPSGKFASVPSHFWKLSLVTLLQRLRRITYAANAEARDAKPR